MVLPSVDIYSTIQFTECASVSMGEMGGGCLRTICCRTYHSTVGSPEVQGSPLDIYWAIQFIQCASVCCVGEIFFFFGGGVGVGGGDENNMLQNLPQQGSYTRSSRWTPPLAFSSLQHSTGHITKHTDTPSKYLIHHKAHWHTEWINNTWYITKHTDTPTELTIPDTSQNTLTHRLY